MRTVKQWTAKEHQYLVDHWPHEHSSVIAEALDRGEQSVVSRARHFKLRKTEEYMERLAIEREEYMLNHTGWRSNGFKKGMEPWNKGARYCHRNPRRQQ